MSLSGEGREGAAARDGYEWTAKVRETGGRWAAFVVAWTTGVAFAVSTVFYQLATLTRHPQEAGAWVIGLLCLGAAVLLMLRLWGAKGRRLHEVAATRVGA